MSYEGTESVPDPGPGVGIVDVGRQGFVEEPSLGGS